MFEPLRITAHLGGGIISDPWLPLDGILLWETCRRQFGSVPLASLPGHGTVGQMKVETPTLPLLFIWDGDYRYYACSFAEWGQPYAEGRDYWNKRDDTDKHLPLLDEKIRRIETAKGRYKAYHMPVFYHVSPWVRWWVVGDIKDIGESLADVFHIGKKRKYGWGRVLNWEIERTPEDRSVFVDGVPQRSVPITDKSSSLIKTGCPRILWGYYPPYYESGNQAECFMPPQFRLSKPE